MASASIDKLASASISENSNSMRAPGTSASIWRVPRMKNLPLFSGVYAR
jgi:hypothetical protein